MCLARSCSLSAAGPSVKRGGSVACAGLKALIELYKPKPQPLNCSVFYPCGYTIETSAVSKRALVVVIYYIPY